MIKIMIIIISTLNFQDDNEFRMIAILPFVPMNTCIDYYRTFCQ